MKDLVVLVADRNIEAGIREILSRPKSIGIALLDFDVFAHPGHDPGCYEGAHDFLRSLRGQYRYALVVFDSDWDGAPKREAGFLEAAVRARFELAGMIGWAEVVVIEPEVEAWVWSDSPHVDRCLGWQGRVPSLRQWLRSNELWPEDTLKPPDPKRAVELALQEVKLVRSSSIYAKLARTVTLENCSDQAFGRLRQCLRTWFAQT